MKRRTKRKIKRFFNRHSYVLFIVPLIVSIFCFGTAYSLLGKNLDINGTARLGDVAIDGATCNIGMEYEILPSWSENFLAFRLTMTNNSDQDMHSITIKVAKGDYQFSWGDGMETTQDDDFYYLSLAPWYYARELGQEEDGSQRSDLHPGESISTTVGVQFNQPTTLEDFIKLGKITNCGQYNEGDDTTTISNGNAVLHITAAEHEIPAVLEYESHEPYNKKIQFKVTVSNPYDYDIKDWRVNIYYGSEYTYDAIWPASFNLISNHEGEYNVDADALNNKILSGGTHEFYLVLIPTNPTLEEDNGSLVYVPDLTNLPDVIAAGIESGIYTRSSG